jgi:hypothetical protein
MMYLLHSPLAKARQDVCESSLQYRATASQRAGVDGPAGSFTSFLIMAICCLTSAGLRSRTHIQGPQRDRDHRRANHSLLDDKHCSICATGLRNSPPENSRAVRARDLRENCSARVLENAAAEILQRVPKVSSLSYREKKSFHDSDIWVAEGVGFEPTIRFPVYTLSKRAPSATRPPLRKGARASRLRATKVRAL